MQEQDQKLSTGDNQKKKHKDLSLPRPRPLFEEREES